MQDHRIRLTDDDMALIDAALAARLPMWRGDRRRRANRLRLRLQDSARGNPNWRLSGEYDETPPQGDELR